MDHSYPFLDALLLSYPGATHDYKAEWGWDRYMVGGKMYAALCLPGPEHAFYGGHPLLTLKCDPLLGECLRTQYSDIHPGFYCNKQHWISVFLDGSVPEEEIRRLCENSYHLIFSNLTKKAQREILGK